MKDLPSIIFKTTEEKCKEMLSEVDSMLHLVKSGKIKRKESLSKKTLPTDFIKAIRTLEYRVNSGTNTKKVYDSSRLKPISPTSLGPGQYFKLKLNDSYKIPRQLTLKDFESNNKVGPKNKSATILSKVPVKKSPKEHNLKVQEKMQKRIEIFNMNNLRKRDRFKLQIKTKLKEEILLYNSELTTIFAQFSVACGVSFIMSEMIINKTVKSIQKIRIRSLFLLGLWRFVTQFLVAVRRSLKRIRKTIASKNIKCITKPFFRFVQNKRLHFRGKVLKHVKFILKMNLLVLLLYKFLRAVRFIQSNFRKYRVVRAIRIQMLHNRCVNLPQSQMQAWLSSTPSIKYEVLIKFYQETAYKYAKSKIKYLYDISAVNKKFVRNFGFWQFESFNQASGRNFTVKLPDPPKFSLITEPLSLIRYINTFDYKSRKKKGRRSLAIEKSYY